MREEFFTQTEWQGIKFSDLGVSLDAVEPASPEFYEAFYRRLIETFPVLEELPEDWRVSKRETAEAIATFVNWDDRLLSYGAGLGYIEQCLVNEHGLHHVSVCDVAPAAKHFDPEEVLTLINTPTNSEMVQEFDVIIMVQVLYALERIDATTVLQNLKRIMAPGGQLILFNTSPNLIENGEMDTLSHTARLRVAARNIPLLRRLVQRLLKRRPGEGVVQGWGWARDNECVRLILNDAGFHSLKFSAMAGQSVVVATL